MIVTSIALARMLTPRFFGLFGLISVFAGFAALFTEMGFGAALIQKKNISNLHLSSVFWLNCICGATLMILFILMAPLIAWFYDEPSLLLLSWGISLSFFISSFGIVHLSLLTRDLDFKTIALARIISSATAGVLAIVMAYCGLGVWSFVGQYLVMALVLAVLLWHFSDWRPERTFSWRAIRDLSSFSLNFMGTQTFNYWVRNLDKLLIGRFWGAEQLGVYSMAYRFLLFPVSNFAAVIANVLFPALSKIQNDKERVKDIYLKVTRSIAIITFPMMLGLLAVSENLVTGVFGEKWTGMIGVLRVFCILGLVQSVTAISGSFYLSQGRADMQFKVGIVLRLVIISGIVIGLKWGILGVAIGYAIMSFACLYPAVYFSGGLVGLTFSEFVYNLSGIFGTTLIMTVFVSGLSFVMPEKWPPLLCLLIQVPAGVGVYVGLVRILHLKAYQEIMEIIYRRFNIS